jgi:hypothetical protein
MERKRREERVSERGEVRGEENGQERREDRRGEEKEGEEKRGLGSSGHRQHHQRLNHAHELPQEQVSPLPLSLSWICLDMMMRIRKTSQHPIEPIRRDRQVRTSYPTVPRFCCIYRLRNPYSLGRYRGKRRQE